MEISNQGVVRLVKARWSHDGTLVLPSPEASAPAGAGADGQPATCPCLVHFVSWGALERSGAAARIAAELELVKKIRSERVLRLLGTGRLEDEAWTALDCPHPVNLGWSLKEWRFLGWEEASRIVSEVARGLNEVHEAGLVAGFLDAFSVQLDPTSQAVALAVLGPGLSVSVRPPGSGVVPGLADGGAATVGSDLRALGLMGIELVCGKTLAPEQLGAARTAQAMESLLFEQAQREFDLPRSVSEALVWLTADDPSCRATSATSVAERFEHLSRTQLDHARQLSRQDHDETEQEDQPGEPSGPLVPPPPRSPEPSAPCAAVADQQPAGTQGPRPRRPTVLDMLVVLVLGVLLLGVVFLGIRNWLEGPARRGPLPLPPTDYPAR